uniref:THD domain-containing protein n=1 Tax=Felis catus TaxID=9685 RepID=A0ABI7Y264_FELCA
HSSSSLLHPHPPHHLLATPLLRPLLSAGSPAHASLVSFLASPQRATGRHGGPGPRAGALSRPLVELGGGSRGCGVCHGPADPANRAAKSKERGDSAAEDWRALQGGRRASVAEPPGAEKHSVLHLVPINITSKEDSDVTEVIWQPALKRGRSLEAQGYVVRVWDTGVYLLYSQVLFHDVTFTMGQVVSREGRGRQETLFRCIRSMPSNPDWAYNSCYSAGVFHLHQGDILSVTIPRGRAKLSLSPSGTFLGFVKL